MRVPERVGMGAVRFSLGRTTTAAEIDAVVERVRACLVAMERPADV
jgi:cysteine desulfurase